MRRWVGAEIAVNEVAYVSGKQTQWLDFLPSPSIVLVASSTFAAVAMLDGCLNVYSLTGRRCVALFCCRCD